MRNVWKGMIIGAFTGAIAGLGLEAVEGGRDHVARGASNVADTVADRLPVAADKTKDAAVRAGETLRDHAPDLVDAGKQAAHTVSDAAQNAADRYRN